MPIGGHLSEEIKITTVAPVVTGTSTITGAAIDMTGFDGALFIVRLGAPATNNNLRVSQCDTVGGSYADNLGTPGRESRDGQPARPRRPALERAVPQVRHHARHDVDHRHRDDHPVSGEEPSDDATGGHPDRAAFVAD